MGFSETDFAEIFAANVTENQSVKTADFMGIFWANFARNRLIWRQFDERV